MPAAPGWVAYSTDKFCCLELLLVEGKSPMIGLHLGQANAGLFFPHYCWGNLLWSPGHSAERPVVSTAPQSR
jgi:hypothetical protein